MKWLHRRRSQVIQDGDHQWHEKKMAAVDWVKMALVYIRLVKTMIWIGVEEAKEVPILNQCCSCAVFL